MDIFLMILAILGLLGGVLVGINEGNPVLFVSGILSFAVLGGFASVISLLKDIHNSLKAQKETSKEVVPLLQEIKGNTLNILSLFSQTGQKTIESTGIPEKRHEEQHKKEEQKRLLEQRRIEEEQKRLLEQRRIEEEKKQREKKQSKDTEVNFSADLELKALRSLLDEGVITQEHYDAKEKELRV